MRAAVYETFCGPVDVRNVDDPAPAPHGVVLKVAATGVCRSDWPGWMGHAPDLEVPHVPGHELSGVVAAVGCDVQNARVGDRVGVPFVCACGACEQCGSGNHQVCDRQTQPGFTHWGSYAEYVAIDYADINLVPLPEDVSFEVAASLGCRFATSFRAVVAQGGVREGQWLAVHGCGGVGLSAVMIGHALGAQVVAVDVDPAALEFAASVGASGTVDARDSEHVSEQIQELTNGGAHVSVDAIGHGDACANSIACLRKRGRHVQVGLLSGEHFRPRLPMELVIAKELEIVGSHGMQAHEYGRMLDMIAKGQLAPGDLIRQRVDLDRAAAALSDPTSLHVAGVTIIDRFE